MLQSPAHQLTDKEQPTPATQTSYTFAALNDDAGEYPTESRRKNTRRVEYGDATTDFLLLRVSGCSQIRRKLEHVLSVGTIQ